MHRIIFERNPKNRSQIFEGKFSHPTGKDAIRIIPLGGAGNVTKNMYVYEYRVDGVIRDILIVDCGIGFPDDEMYGIDLVLPDIRYLEGKKDKIRGMVFTHGHDDHIAGLPHLYPKLTRTTVLDNSRRIDNGQSGQIRFPMYAPKLAAAFANVKLKETSITDRVQAVDFDRTVTMGVFRVSFIRLTHSIPDTSHLIIETPVGIFYHGSDFKFDPTPLDGKPSEIAKINAVGKRGVLCMLSDSLGSERPGFTPSEQIIGDTIEKELKACPGKLLFTTQSSNISRIQLAIELAIQYGRKIAFLGRSVDRNVEEALKLGYMNFPRDVVISDRDLKRMPPGQQFLVVAGAQGQTDSNLSRIAHDAHKLVRLTDQDTVVISADPIPGREQDVNALIDQIYRHGARVSYSDIMEDLHVSGHGSSGDMMLLLSAVGPRYVMPIGGTYKHLMQYRRLAMELGYDKRDVLIPEDGEVLEFIPGKSPKVVDRINLENVMIDGLGVGDVGDVVLRDRQTIAKEGIVVVVVPIEASSGRQTSPAEIISRGFVYVKESGTLLKRANQVIAKSLVTKRGRIEDWQFIRKRIETTLASFLLEQTGRRPLIVPVILEV
jgi:ribonuclease J